MTETGVAIVLLCLRQDEIAKSAGAASGECSICGTPVWIDEYLVLSLKQGVDEVWTVCRLCVMEKARKVELNWIPLYSDDSLAKAKNAGNN